ncbi:glycerophosphodiester phosphodiesterase [Jiangella rhizosphaerae]|uniref:Glycerophosphodiester phosphodiesterase n=1 Tax=Jiangella rhizosphaerae TaxID=2293569 RepID=A0A418KKP5_9ACTN|nr:glycerophosphodiester phosphodiesterase family protein [Jiangella rhizosphaerae]RIQ17859.1 glycerophosphodiester phosphodiesterase [Jiangella rhizosphaerae]
MLICAHRGSPAEAPENTLASFRRAVADGAGEIELDLRVSADGRLVVIHDATVDRTTNGTGAVADLRLEQIQALDAGGERIPSFEEVLDGVGARLQVEIKAAEAVEPLAELLQSRPADLGRISPCAFDPGVVADLVRLFPAAPVGLIASAGSAETLAHAADLAASRVLFGWPGTTRALVTRARQHGMEVSVWPVNTPDQLRRALDLGVDGFTTDHPGVIGDELARIGRPRS